MMLETPQAIATEAFTKASAAVDRLEEIYERNTKFLRDRFEAYAHGGALSARVRAFYPFVRITTSTYARLNSRLAYGFVARPGVHETSVTRPDLFRNYLHRANPAFDRKPRRAGRNRRVERADSEFISPIDGTSTLKRHSAPTTTRSSRDCCATCSIRLTLQRWMTRSPTARLNCRRVLPSRSPCSGQRAWTIRCAGSITTRAPIRSTSRIS